MANTDIYKSRPVEELVFFLKELLEPYGFRLGTDLSLKVSYVFRVYNVKSIYDVINQKSKLAPVIVKSEEEQKLFHYILNNYQTAVNEEEEIASQPKLSFFDLRDSKGRWNKYFISLIVFCLLFSTYSVFYHLRPTKQTATPFSPTFEIAKGDTLLTRQEVHFLNTTVRNISGKKTEPVNFTWKFDDSVIKSNEAQIIHRFLTAGNHTVSLTAHVNKFPDSTTTASYLVNDECELLNHATLRSISIDTVVIENNFTNASKQCLKSYHINFGDGTSRQFTTAVDTIIHTYPPDGPYTIFITANNIYGVSFAHAFVTSTFMLPSKILDFSPRTIPVNITRSNTNAYWILIALTALLITAIIIATIILIKTKDDRKTLKQVKKRFVPEKRRAGAWSYKLTTDTSNVSFEGAIQVFDDRLSGVMKTTFGKIDVHETIYNTIRKAGFPQLRYLIPRSKKDYIFLVDLGSGNNQQAELFELLIEQEVKSGIDFKLFYYRNDPFYLSVSKKMDHTIRITDLERNNSGSNLIIFGDGYGFLPGINTTNSDTASPCLTVLEKWQRKALITPVPRSNWSRNERALYALTPIYPATPRGLELIKEAMSLPRHRQRMPSREDAEPYMFFPVSNDIAEYEWFFLEDTRLLIWLYALALADQPDWAVTIAVGNALEENYFGQGTSLVNYSNLLKLTSVEWMQTGSLSIAHRQQMMDQLRKEPDAKKIIRITAEALLKLSSKVKVESGTLTELQKDIREEIWRQWAQDDHLVSVGWLDNKNYVDNFNSKELQKEKKIKNVFSLSNELQSLGGAIIAMVLIGSLVLNDWSASSSLANKYFPPVIEADSFAYYNNLACEAMNRYDTRIAYYLVDSASTARTMQLYTNRKLIITPRLLSQRSNNLFNKAESFNNKDTTTIRNNRKILRYTVAKSLYDDSLYSQAIDSFRMITGRDSIGLNAWYVMAASYVRENKPDSACLIVRFLDSVGFKNQPPLLNCVPKRAIPNAARLKSTRLSNRRSQATIPLFPVYMSPGKKALYNAIAELAAGARAYTINGNGNMGPFVKKYNAIAGLKEGIPWASTFVSWCFNKDVKYFKPLASTLELEKAISQVPHQYFSIKDAILPRPGDIYFYDWNDYNTTATYRAVGIVESYDATLQKLTGIEGNSNDSVGLNYKVAAVTFNDNDINKLNFRFARVPGKVNINDSIIQNSITYVIPDSIETGRLATVRAIYTDAATGITEVLPQPSLSIKLSDAKYNLEISDSDNEKKALEDTVMWMWQVSARRSGNYKLLFDVSLENFSSKNVYRTSYTANIKVTGKELSESDQTASLKYNRNKNYYIFGAAALFLMTFIVYLRSYYYRRRRKKTSKKRKK